MSGRGKGEADAPRGRNATRVRPDIEVPTPVYKGHRDGAPARQAEQPEQVRLPIGDATLRPEHARLLYAALEGADKVGSRKPIERLASIITQDAVGLAKFLDLRYLVTGQLGRPGDEKFEAIVRKIEEEGSIDVVVDPLSVEFARSSYYVVKQGAGEEVAARLMKTFGTTEGPESVYTEPYADERDSIVSPPGQGASGIVADTPPPSTPLRGGGTTPDPEALDYLKEFVRSELEGKPMSVSSTDTWVSASLPSWAERVKEHTPKTPEQRYGAVAYLLHVSPGTTELEGAQRSSSSGSSSSSTPSGRTSSNTTSSPSTPSSTSSSSSSSSSPSMSPSDAAVEMNIDEVWDMMWAAVNAEDAQQYEQLYQRLLHYDENIAHSLDDAFFHMRLRRDADPDRNSPQRQRYALRSAYRRNNSRRRLTYTEAQ